MYFSSFGGSTLLHVLAGHPRLIAIFGIAAAASMLSSPLGPGAHLGSDRYAKQVEGRFLKSTGVSDATFGEIERTADRLVETNNEDAPSMIASALAKCGSNCSDLGVSGVMQDPALEREVLIMYLLDELKAHRGDPSQVPAMASLR